VSAFLRRSESLLQIQLPRIALARTPPASTTSHTASQATRLSCLPLASPQCFGTAAKDVNNSQSSGSLPAKPLSAHKVIQLLHMASSSTALKALQRSQVDSARLRSLALILHTGCCNADGGVHQGRAFSAPPPVLAMPGSPSGQRQGRATWCGREIEQASTSYGWMGRGLTKKSLEEALL